MVGLRCLPCWVAASALALSGCLPDAIVWAPDSSGIIFSTQGTDTTPERKAVTAIRHFDIQSKAMHVVVSSKERTATKLPAFSPDGKQVAVAHAWSWSRGQYIQVRTYRLDGSIDVASEAFRLFSPLAIVFPDVFKDNPLSGSLHPTGWSWVWEENPSPPKRLFERPHIVESSVEWAADGKHLLVDTPMGCARYDLTTKKFRQFAPSVTVGLRGFIERSTLPNGQGFLAVWSGSGWSPNTPVSELLPLLKSLVVVDWEGISRPFAVSPEAEQAVKRCARGDRG